MFLCVDMPNDHKFQQLLSHSNWICMKCTLEIKGTHIAFLISVAGCCAGSRSRSITKCRARSSVDSWLLTVCLWNCHYRLFKPFHIEHDSNSKNCEWRVQQFLTWNSPWTWVNRRGLCWTPWNFPKLIKHSARVSRYHLNCFCPFATSSTEMLKKWLYV